MLTAKQIEEAKFAKERNGYSIKEVDDFMDQCAATVAALLEERSANNKKMQVLADKLVEYRNDEDSIRAALVNAQRLADNITRESKQKADLTQEDANIKAEKIVADAQAKADGVLNGVTEQVKAEEEELARVKHEVSQFKERMLSIYKEHLSLINLLPEEPAEKVKEEPAEKLQEEAKEDPVEVKEPEEVKESAIEELTEVPAEYASSQESDAAEAEEKQIELTALADLADLAASAEEVKSEDTQADEEQVRSRFADLKFGEDYVIADDTDEAKGGKGLFHRKK